MKKGKFYPTLRTWEVGNKIFIFIVTFLVNKSVPIIILWETGQEKKNKQKRFRDKNPVDVLKQYGAVNV